VRVWEPGAKLTANVNSGVNSFTVDNATGFAPGDSIILSPGENQQETLTIQTVDLTSNTITTVSVTTQTHDTDDVVVSTNTEGIKVTVGGVSDTSGNSLRGEADTIELLSGMVE